MSSFSREGAGVRVNEVDLSTTIAQNSNVTAGLVAVHNRGPIGPTRYTNFDNYKADFGVNAKISFDGYSAEHYFKQGNSLWVRRAVGAGSDYGCLVLYVSAVGATVLAPVTVQDPTNPDWANITPAGSTPIHLFYPYRGPGSYSSDLAIQLLSENLPAPTGLNAASSATGGVIAPSTLSYYVAAKSKNGEYLASAPVTIVVTSVLNTSSVTLTWQAVPGAVSYVVYGRDTTTPGFLAEVGYQTLTYTDDGLTVVDTAQAPNLTQNDLPDASTNLKLNVFDLSVNSSTPVEPFDVSLEEKLDDSGINMEAAFKINSFSSYIRVTSNTAALLTYPTLYAAPKTAFAAGDSGATPTSADINNAWAVFNDKQRYVLDVLINSGKTATAVMKGMDSLAQKRFDCVAFLDTPSNLQKAQQAIDFRNITLNLNSSFSALFCSDLYVSDPVNGKELFIPPSGAMAGLLAYTTRVSQPWFAIAGLNRGLVDALDVRYTYDDGDSTALFQAQVNYMRKFLGKGIPLWEQSTLLAAQSALQFLNVRILCNVIKRSVYDYLLYSVHEPNDDLLQKNIRNGLGDYLSYVQGKRGIKRFIVQCDINNNPDIVANTGNLQVGVYIVPVLGTRQINLSLLIGKQGLEVTETDLAAFQ